MAPAPRNPLGVLASREEWLPILEGLPDLTETSGRIPAFFFAHGHPTLLWPKDTPFSRPGMFGEISKPNGILCQFLQDFGKVLLEKYKPKAIVVFSAHWETHGERLVSDYGDENPLLYDYYNFPQSLYDITWRSRGSSSLAQRVVQEFHKAGIKARTTPVTEDRGEDGRRVNRPLHNSGLDHGVFIPFKIMFPDDQGPFPIPVVQVSIDSDFRPEREYEIGRALKSLRDEGVLILCGGLVIHTFKDLESFHEGKAKPLYHDWNDKIVKAIQISGTDEERKQAVFDLTKEPEFRKAHPREDHWAPIHVAQGAGEGSRAILLSGMYGATSVAYV